MSDLPHDFKIDRFRNQVIRFRKQEKLTQSEVARIAGISRNYLSLIERGQAENLSMAIVQRLRETLGITTSYEAVDAYHLPAGLWQFAKDANLPNDDIMMLACVKYRGKQPRTSAHWRILYKVIKAVLEDA